MTPSQLIGTIVGAWASLTLGLVMLTGSAAVVPLSVGLALGAVAFVFGRKLYYEELRKPEAKP